MHISSQKRMYEATVFYVLAQIGGSNFKNSPICKVETSL